MPWNIEDWICGSFFLMVMNVHMMSLPSFASWTYACSCLVCWCAPLVYGMMKTTWKLSQSNVLGKLTHSSPHTPPPPHTHTLTPTTHTHTLHLHDGDSQAATKPCTLTWGPHVQDQNEFAASVNQEGNKVIPLPISSCHIRVNTRGSLTNKQKQCSVIYDIH